MDYCGVVRVVVPCIAHGICKYTYFIVFSTMLEGLAVNSSVIVVFCLCVFLVSFTFVMMSYVCRKFSVLYMIAEIFC